MSLTHTDDTADVVVAGTGAAGCAAAIEAHDSGASVMVLEKTTAESAGGNTRVSGGAWFHHENPERAAVYLRSLCGDRTLPEPVVTAWADGTSQVTAWFRTLGISTSRHTQFHQVPEFPELEGSDCYLGVHVVDGVMGGGRLHAALADALSTRGIPVRYETAAVELTSADGEVVGVTTSAGDTIGVRGGVVLTTGGFEGDAEMVREYLGLRDVPVWGSTAATGDGHGMWTPPG
ncbi:FAD-dependent oxidoreductase [Gordonia sp. NPDC127522]|uniref:FAD-dependent oxidoreductase n=1 Tax=Gordonia sp. NPDC127522 TaxID=3345390 RepID=UPI0036388D2B